MSGLWRDKGADQLLRGTVLRQIWEKVRAYRGLARGSTGALPLDVGPVLDVDPHRQRLPRRLSRLDLVHHGHHEDRPRRAQESRTRHGP